jgi:hypothetical protein
MGWSYRKSLNLGPFRVNVSKSGIGYSIGGGGFRTGTSARGRHYSSCTIPGTGLRYYKSSAKSATGCLLAFLTVLAALAGGFTCLTILLTRNS